MDPTVHWWNVLWFVGGAKLRKVNLSKSQKGRKKRTGKPTSKRIVRHTLPTNMEQRPSKINSSHLQRIIHTPKRRTKRVGDPGETTARSGVGFEHEEALAIL